MWVWPTGICTAPRAGAMLDFLFPAECRLCGCVLPRGSRCLCPLCSAGLQRTGYHRDPDNALAMRLAGRIPFERATGHFLYTPEAPVAMLIHDMKYRGMYGVARELGRIAGGELAAAGWLAGIDVLVPVPLHWMKRMRRGYNQAEELARGVGEGSGIAVLTALRAIRGHKSQTRVSRAQRAVNVRGIFRLRHPDGVAGRHILLIDDVCTTGATLVAAAEALLAAAPGARLSILTIACIV